MPNRNDNTLFVLGKSEEIAAFKDRAAKAVPFEEPSPFNFHNFIPVPTELLEFGGKERTGYDFILGGCLTKRELDRENGKKLRIDWEIKNWGIKWGGYDVCLEEKHPACLQYRFETPWGPPIVFLHELAKLYPGLAFRLYSICGNDEVYDYLLVGDFVHETDKAWLPAVLEDWTCGAIAEKPAVKKSDCENG